MNTPPLSDTQHPPAWMVTFTDGTVATNDTQSWSNFSEPVELDGVTVYETTRPVSSVSLKDRYGQIHTLVLPEERALYPFAFKRNAISVTNPAIGHRWLYSCFGYALPTYRVLLIATPTGFLTRVESRLTPFAL